MSFIRPNKVPHAKVQYLPRYREAKSRNLLFYNGTVHSMHACISREITPVESLVSYGTVLEFLPRFSVPPYKINVFFGSLRPGALTG